MLETIIQDIKQYVRGLNIILFGKAFGAALPVLEHFNAQINRCSKIINNLADKLEGVEDMAEENQARSMINIGEEWQF